jgi:phenylacetate-coenzyme A ligase PaaK-like adenylate-forming protein
MNTHLLTTNWHRLPEHTIRKLQAGKLRHYLRNQVIPFSPYYRDLFQSHNLSADRIRSLSDLERIPFTSKTDLINTPERPQKVRDFILQPDRTQLAHRPSTMFNALVSGRENAARTLELEYRPIFMTCTTGRSADSVVFLFTHHDLNNLAAAGKRIFEICGAQPDYRLLNTFPYAPHLAFWLAHYGGTEFNTFVASSGGGKVFGTDGQLRMIRQLQPQVLIGMPTFIYHVLSQALEAGMQCPTLKRIVLGGEKVAPGMRQKLARIATELGAEAIDIVATYGFTEAKMAWAECPNSVEGQTGYHLCPDLGIIEIIDPKSGEVVPEGHAGEIVFTPLDSRGSVVVRYRTGDLIDGGLVYEPCPHCKRTLPRLVGNISRVSEIRSMRFDKLKGTLVDFNLLEHVLDDAPHLDSWQLELLKRNNDPLELDELVLHVHKSDGFDDTHCAQELRRQFVSRTEIQPNRIVFHDNEEMTRLLGIGTQLKEQRVVDHRPKANGETPGIAGIEIKRTVQNPSPSLPRSGGDGRGEEARSSDVTQAFRTADSDDFPVASQPVGGGTEQECPVNSQTGMSAPHAADPKRKSSKCIPEVNAS